MVCIGKSFEFSACHKLWCDDLSAEENLKLFGKCANPNGHGHNYTLEVSVTGNINNRTGMIFDTSKLTKIVNQFIIDELDHKNLDLDVNWLKGRQATSENLVEAIWARLETPISNEGISLAEIRLQETKRIFAFKRA